MICCTDAMAIPNMHTQQLLSPHHHAYPMASGSCHNQLPDHRNSQKFQEIASLSLEHDLGANQGEIEHFLNLSGMHVKSANQSWDNYQPIRFWFYWVLAPSNQPITELGPLWTNQIPSLLGKWVRKKTQPLVLSKLPLCGSNRWTVFGQWVDSTTYY